jgi:hypothetical protein
MGCELYATPHLSPIFLKITWAFIIFLLVLGMLLHLISGVVDGYK